MSKDKEIFLHPCSQCDSVKCIVDVMCVGLTAHATKRCITCGWVLDNWDYMDEELVAVVSRLLEHGSSPMCGTYERTNGNCRVFHPE